MISVIVPCYNVERYLDRCMKTLVGQTYKDLEIILVDDGSKDSTGEICDRWAALDGRVKVIHKENGGLGFARNSGLEIASGDYIAFVDSDDFVDESLYQRLMKAVEDNGADIAYCGHIKQLSDGSALDVRDFEDVRVFGKDDLLELSQGFFRPTSITPRMLTMSVWHAVYRRDIIRTAFYSEREVGSEDIHFQVSTMLNAGKVVFIPDTLYTYCYNGESLSHQFNLARYQRYRKLCALIDGEYTDFGINRIADYCMFIMAFASVRKIALSTLSEREKRDAIGSIVKDDFWNNDTLNSIKLGGAKKLFYKVLKTRSVALMSLMAKGYCLLNYKIAKKGLE